MLSVSELKMDYQDSPIGTAGMPVFSWILESDRRNVLQRAWQLQIAGGASFEKPLYDSGWQEGGESAHVRVEKRDFLKSCTAYYVRVRVRDAVEESGFCAPCRFVTGLLDNREWKAAFVTGESVQDKDRSGSTYLRREITLVGEVAEAYACTTALGLYHFYINGEKVGEDELTPGWTSYHKHLCYQVYDVGGLLREGRNMLGAMVGAGWYKGKMGFLHVRNNYGERAAFLMQLVVRYRDGREEVFVTDESFEAADGPVLFSEIYDGETYDARKEIPGWNRCGCEKAGLSGGSGQGAVKPAQGGAGEGLPGKSDRIPGDGEHTWRPVESVAFPREALTPQSGSRVGVMERLPAQRIFTTPKGEKVIDFGQNLTGWVEFQVRAGAGEEVRFRCFEVLDGEGNVYTENLRTAKQQISYICRGGGERYHPHFTFQGFRYAWLLSYPGEPEAEDFTALVVHSRMERTGTFACSHPLVNQLQHNILWSMKGNFLDIPTDCPQRDERMGWTGDAQIFCRTACYLMNTYTFYEKWLRDVAADQTLEGGVPHVVPDIISGRKIEDPLLSQGTHSAAAWGDVAVINPWTLYLVFGDKTILEKQYDSMKKWIDFMREHAQDYIWNYKLQFGDWVALDAEEGSCYGATPNDLTCTAYFAYSTGLFVKAARALGREEEAGEYQALYEKIVEKFQRTFFLPEGSLTAQTQTAHIVALYFGLVPEQWRQGIAKRLVELLAERDGHLVTGFVGTPYFCHALSGNGYTKEAYDLLLKEDFPSWLYQVKAGATTVWEHWDGRKPDGTFWSPSMNSFNHYAYGAVGDWLYRVVLGMEADEAAPGYRHSIISPRTGDAFDYAEGTYRSVYGEISVHWEKGEAPGERLLTVTIPHNTTAKICLEEGAQGVLAEGLEFAEREGIWQTDCGSGTWKIRYQRTKELL